jgi:hypothetical protein
LCGYGCASFGSYGPTAQANPVVFELDAPQINAYVNNHLPDVVAGAVVAWKRSTTKLEMSDRPSVEDMTKHYFAAMTTLSRLQNAAEKRGNSVSHQLDIVCQKWVHFGGLSRLHTEDANWRLMLHMLHMLAEPGNGLDLRGTADPGSGAPPPSKMATTATIGGTRWQRVRNAIAMARVISMCNTLLEEKLPEFVLPSWYRDDCKMDLPPNMFPDDDLDCNADLPFKMNVARLFQRSLRGEILRDNQKRHVYYYSPGPGSGAKDLDITFRAKLGLGQGGSLGLWCSQTGEELLQLTFRCRARSWFAYNPFPTEPLEETNYYVDCGVSVQELKLEMKSPAALKVLKSAIICMDQASEQCTLLTDDAIMHQYNPTNSRTVSQ